MTAPQGGRLGSALCLAFLLLNALTDIKRRHVRWPGCAAAGLLGLALRIPGGKEQVLAALPALLPGSVLTALSLMPGQAVGLGDGLVVLACGMLTGLSNTLGMLFYALLLAGGYGIFLLLVRRKGRKESFPFVPFLLAGMILTMLAG